ncbi:unnamed protein product [Tilletia controversa]|nr:unnamed protein product [Tilletia caries]CAD6963087.1 unnamed protein product [Tilletia controversa]CAD6980963.1 unnamed protein product [Tilletia controversa]
MTMGSTIASVFVNVTLVADYVNTKQFRDAGSGLTRKQRELVIMTMLVLFYLSIGALPPIATSSAPPALNPTPIIPSLLFLGPAPSHPAHWAGLRALGVKRVLNVAEEVDLDVPTVHPGKGRRGGAGTAGEAEAEAEVKCRKVGIQDYVEEQPGEDMLRQGSEFLNESIHAQEPIYVHCLAGRSRSPTAIIAYLIR